VPCAHLSVQGHDRDYELLLTVRGSIQSFASKPGANVRGAVEQLNKEADQLAVTVEQWDAASERQREQDVEALRRAGKDVAEAFFGDGVEDFYEALRAAGDPIVDVLWMDAPLPLPWHLLWLEKPGIWLGELTMFRTARKAPIMRPIPGRLRPPLKINVGYAEDDALSTARKDWSGPSSEGEEVHAVERLVARRGGDILVLAEMSAGPLDARETDRLNTWLSRGNHLFHFNCHSEPPRTHKDLERIFVRSGAEMTVGNLQGNLNPSGAFILNICSSAGGKHDDSRSLAAALRDRRVRALCAVTNKMSDRFGTLFIGRMYDELPEAEHNLFAAMRSAQLKLTQESRHPLALYYVFEGDPTFEVGR